MAKKKRGFAALTKKERSKIAAKGGRAHGKTKTEFAEGELDTMGRQENEDWY